MTSFLLWCILVAWILMVLIPLINNILTPWTIEIINDMLDNLEYFIGSDNITIFLSLLVVIIIIWATRFFTRFFHVNNE